MAGPETGEHAPPTEQKRSKKVTLGLLATAGIALILYGNYEVEDGEYLASKAIDRVYYASGTGAPHYCHDDQILRPLPADHPQYGAAVREWQDIAMGRSEPGGHLSVKRGGFGYSADLHCSSTASS